MISRYLVITAGLLIMYLRQVMHKYIIRKEVVVSMDPEYSQESKNITATQIGEKHYIN